MKRDLKKIFDTINAMRKCPICGHSLFYALPSERGGRLRHPIECEDPECEWYYGIGPLREAVMKALR